LLGPVWWLALVWPLGQRLLPVRLVRLVVALVGVPLAALAGAVEPEPLSAEAPVAAEYRFVARAVVHLGRHLVVLPLGRRHHRHRHRHRHRRRRVGVKLVVVVVRRSVDQVALWRLGQCQGWRLAGLVMWWRLGRCQ
jgi:hypothetical protein